MSIRRLLKESVVIGLGQVSSLLGNLYCIGVFSSALGPEKFGEFALLFTLATLNQQVLFGPVTGASARFLEVAREKNAIPPYFRAIKKLWVNAAVATLITGSAFGVVSIAVLAVTTTDSVALLISYCVLNGITSICIGIQNAGRNRLSGAIQQGLEPWLRALVFYCHSESAAATLKDALVSHILVSLLFVLVQLISTKTLYRGNSNELTSPPAQLWGKMLFDFAWPIGATGVLSWAVFASHRWAIQQYGTLYDVGIFSVLLQLGFTSIAIAGGSAQNLLTPIIFKRAGAATDSLRVAYAAKLINQSAGFACALLFLIVILAAVFSAPILTALAGDEYLMHSGLLPILVLSSGVFQISTLVSSVALVANDTSKLIPLNTIGNLLLIIVNIIGAKYHGMIGLAHGILLGSLIHLLWNIYNANKITSLSRAQPS